MYVQKADAENTKPTYLKVTAAAKEANPKLEFASCKFFNSCPVMKVS